MQITEVKCLVHVQLLHGLRLGLFNDGLRSLVTHIRTVRHCLNLVSLYLRHVSDQIGIAS